MLCHSLGGAVILFTLQHFIAPALDLMPCLPSRHRREAIRALNGFGGQIRLQVDKIFSKQKLVYPFKLIQR